MEKLVLWVVHLICEIKEPQVELYITGKNYG